MTKRAAAKDLDTLAPNAANPRKPFSAEELQLFRDSLDRFGDLGGIVHNNLTKRLVGGHKRVEAFRNATSVDIRTELQPCDRQGTVAVGYVVVDGVRFAYREVEWSPETEIAANLAANRWGAEWDWRLVSDALKAIGDEDLRALTGFSDDELSNLMAADWTVPAKTDLMNDDTGHSVKLSGEQWALLSTVKTTLDPTGTITDADAIEAVCRRFLEH